jgi:Zn-dependent peptidase ImmA (M78 family)
VIIMKNPSELVDEILKCYKEKVGNLNFPINEYILINIIEELKGINIELEKIKGKNIARLNEGILIPKRGGFLIKYDINPLIHYNGNERIITSVARKRFTICHELAHVLFYDCNSSVPKLYEKPEEHICDEIARKLLLPEEPLKLKFQRYRSDGNLIPFLREITKEARVSIYPLVKRVIEDLSLLKNVMITFWFLKRSFENGYQIENPKVILNRTDSKLCGEYKKILTPFWRERIREQVWDRAIKIIIDGTKKPPILLHSLCIESKRRRKGRLKSILFNVECNFYYEQQSLFKWDRPFLPQFISVEKFDEVKLWP